MNYCHVAGRFSGRGCVICTGGCSIVRWINHLALIAAKLFEMYETQKLAVRALTYVSFPRNVLFGLAAFRRRQRKEERKRERERERDSKASKTIYIRQKEPSWIPLLNYCLFDILIFLGQELFSSFFLHG